MGGITVSIIVWLANDSRSNIYIYVVLTLVFGIQYLSDFSQSSYSITRSTLKMSDFLNISNNRCAILFRKIGIIGGQRWVDRALGHAMIPLFKNNYLIDQNSDVPYGYGNKNPDYLPCKVWIVINTNSTDGELQGDPARFYSQYKVHM